MYIRRSRVTTVAAAAILGAALLGVQDAHAATAHTTAPLAVRAGTDVGSAFLTEIPSGTAIDVECQQRGQAISGTYNSDWWAKVTYDGHTGFASRAYISVPMGTSVPVCADTEPEPDPAGKITRAEVLQRAQTWVDQQVGYSMWNYHPDPDGVLYRTDCSGFVSMAYRLGESYSTVTLGTQLTWIPKEELRLGDAVGNLGEGTGGANGHIVLFNGWTDETQTSFHTIEERGDAGAIKGVRTWGSDQYTQNAWRYNHIGD